MPVRKRERKGGGSEGKREGDKGEGDKGERGREKGGREGRRKRKGRERKGREGRKKERGGRAYWENTEQLHIHFSLALSYCPPLDQVHFSDFS